MKTPNVYCATCSMPLGTGSHKVRYFCGEACERLFPGLHAARNALITALVLSAACSSRETAELFKLSRQSIEGIVRGR